MPLSTLPAQPGGTHQPGRLEAQKGVWKSAGKLPSRTGSPWPGTLEAISNQRPGLGGGGGAATKRGGQSGGLAWGEAAGSGSRSGGLA